MGGNKNAGYQITKELKFCHLQVGLQAGVGLQVLVEDCFGVLGFAHSFLELDERHPGFFSGAPLHPPGEDVSGFRVLPDEFFHVGVFEPELIFSGEVVDGSFPNIPGVVDELVLHFHFGVLQP